MKHLIFSFFILWGGLTWADADIPNFAQVTPKIYRGGRPTDAGMRCLKSLGVKTDINLQGGDINWDDPAAVAFMSWWEPGEIPANIAKEKALAENELQMIFCSAPINSLVEITEAEDENIDRALAAMNDPAFQPVFVHCEHGKDRTGLLVALYRVKFQGVSVKAAYAEWAASGHRGIGAYFTKSLDRYFYKKVAQILNDTRS